MLSLCRGDHSNVIFRSRSILSTRCIRLLLSRFAAREIDGFHEFVVGLVARHLEPKFHRGSDIPSSAYPSSFSSRGKQPSPHSRGDGRASVGRRSSVERLLPSLK